MGTNVDILRSMLAKVQAGDYAGAEELLHPDLVVDEPESITHGGLFRGRDASRRVKEIIRAIWDQQMGELQTYDCGDAIITRREITWTAKATGKSAPCTAVEFFEFRDGKVARITVYLRDTNGNLYEAQRSATEETKTGNQTVSNTAVYEPTVNGSMSLKRQSVTKTTTNADGSSTQDVEIFGRASDGIARAENAPPSLTEKRTIERQKGSGGAVVETQTVQLPSVNDPGRLDAARKVSETICRGECDKKP